MIRRPVEVLLVEDSEDDIVILQRAFARTGSLRLIEVARNGKHALGYLRGNEPYTEPTKPDMVLLDVNLPGMSGFEVLEEIKSDPDLRAIPVVVMTVSDREEDIVRAYSSGACSYLRKPPELETLHEMIEVFDRYWNLVSRLPMSGGTTRARAMHRG